MALCTILLVEILIAHVSMFEAGGHGFLYPTFERSNIEDNSVQQVQPTMVVNVFERIAQFQQFAALCLSLLLYSVDLF